MSQSRKVLVTGGAGYVGSHVLLILKQVGYTPIVVDNLSHGHKEAVLDCELMVGDLGDRAFLKEVFTKHSFTAVMHFAGLNLAEESVQFPHKYYNANVVAFVNLLDTMLEHKVKDIVFSSTAAVYGIAQADRIHEGVKLQPTTPFARSKKIAEEILMDYAGTGNINYSILRYFNAAGSDPLGRIGERHSPETHLIPSLLTVAAGKRPSFIINGDSHATSDGSCIRDFVHVSDLSNAHLLALKNLLKGKRNTIYNLGTGRGYSVRQVIEAVKRVTKKDIPITIGKMRPGEVPKLVADPELAKQELAWKVQYDELDSLILHAWQYMQKNSQ